MKTLKEVLDDLSYSALHPLYEEWQHIKKQQGRTEGDEGDKENDKENVKDKDTNKELSVATKTDRTAATEPYRKALYDWLLDVQCLSHMYHACFWQECEVLHEFLFHVQDDFLTYRQLEQRQNRSSPAFRIGLTGLRRKGIVYTLRRQWGEVAYFIPTDVQSLLYQMVLEEQGVNGFEVWQEQVQPEEVQRLFLFDCFQLVDQWRQQRDHLLPLTKKKTIHKRVLRSWEQMLVQREPFLEALSLPVVDKQTYSNHMALLFQFLTDQEIIHWYADGVELDVPKTEQWLRQSQVDLIESFLAFWLRIYQPEAPWLKQYMKDMWLFWHSHHSREEEWIPILSFVERWEEYYDLPSISELQQQIEAFVLQPLYGLGLIQFGQTKQGEKVWRLYMPHEQEVPLYLQPDLELFVPAQIPLHTLWRLTEWFEGITWDVMSILQLSRSRVQRYFEQGGSEQAYLDWFSSLLAHPLPDAFVDQLQQWVRDQQKIQISDQTVIEIADPQLFHVAQEWLVEQDVSYRVLSERFLAIPLQFKQSVVTLIEKKGFSVHMDDSMAEKNTKDTIVPPLIAARDHAEAFQVESVFPAWEEAIPVWSRIPDMWKKQLLSYHDQTKRDLLQTAIEHGLKIKLEDDERNIRTIAPQRCQMEDGVWVCEDENQHRYLVQNMKRVQLLFPLGHDP